MKFGLTPEELNYLEKNLIIPLKSLDAKVWIFGSRARGDHRKFSDLDILVESARPETQTLISKIREVFEEGNFPYKVDIVYFKDLAKSYKSNVISERILL